MKKNKLYIIDIFVLIILIILDQLTKYFAVIKLKNQPSFSLIDGVLEFNYLENKGAAFGMLQNQKIFFVLVALVFLAIIIFVLIKTPQDKKYNILHIILVAIGAGAIGNMIDRLRLDYVIDFIYFSLIDFPVFNVADIYVTVSTVLLIILILFIYDDNDYNFLSFKNKKLER